jgi:hypothetical protein
MDEAMFELRDRLKSVSENLRKSRLGSAETARPADEVRRRPSNPVPPPIGRKDYIPERLPADRWPGFLRKLSLKLDALTGDTESGFVSIGASLFDIRKRANKITEISETVAHIITDKQISSNIDELKWVVSRMRDWLSSPTAEASMSSRHLNTKMLVDKTGICLNTLEKKYYKSEFILTEFTDKTGEIANSINKIIESLQYSDITRQNVEHVKSDINAIEARLVGVGFGRPVIDLNGARDVVGEVGGACAALALELRKACAEFDTAVKSIISNLQVVSSDTAEMSEDIVQVVKGDSESGKSFMSAIGNWLSNLMNTLSAFRPGPSSLCSEPGNGMDSPEVGGLEVPDEFGCMVAELCSIVTSLRTINGNILYRLSLMEDESKILSREIEAAVKKFGDGARVVDIGEGVASGLDKLAQEAALIAPAEVSLYSAGHKAWLQRSSGQGFAGIDRTRKAGDDGQSDDNVVIF